MHDYFSEFHRKITISKIVQDSGLLIERRKIHIKCLVTDAIPGTYLDLANPSKLFIFRSKCEKIHFHEIQKISRSN